MNRVTVANHHDQGRLIQERHHLIAKKGVAKLKKSSGSNTNDIRGGLGPRKEVGFRITPKLDLSEKNYPSVRVIRNIK